MIVLFLPESDIMVESLALIAAVTPQRSEEYERKAGNCS